MSNPAAERGITHRYFAWWADHTLVQLMVFVFFTVTALLGYFYPDPIRDLLRGREDAPGVLHGRLPVTVVSAQQSVARDRRANRRFEVGGSDCIIVATSDQFFTTNGVAAMRSVAARLEALPQVNNVVWIDRIPSLNLFGLGESPLPRRDVSARQLEMARERILENPLATGQLISGDGKTLLLLVSLDWFYVTSDEACTSELRETAEKAAAEFSGTKIGFRVTGQAPLHLMMVNNHLTDSLKYQLVGYSIMILSALVLFRGFAAVTLVAIAPAVGVFWTMGWLFFFNFQDNPFNDVIVPVLISLVGLTDSVHLMSEIRNQRARGLEPRQAARVAIARVGMACFITSLTSAIGFISLVTAHHEIVREFGWCCVTGALMTFISVLTVVPLGCRSPLGRRLHVGIGKGLVDRQLGRVNSMIDWVLRHDRGMSYFAILLTATLAAYCWKLEPDEKRYSGLSDSGEAARALRHLDEALGGLEFARLEIRWKEATEQGQILEVLDRMSGSLRAEPLIGQPLGLYEILEALPGEGSPAERMTLLELLPPSLKQTYYQPETYYASIQFRVRDLGIARYAPVFERIEATASQVMREFSGFSVRLEGEAAFRWRHVYRIVQDLAKSLGSAGLVIWLVLVVAFRSFRLGLISIFPNIFPLAVTGSILVFLGQHLEMVTVCVFTICGGLAVDDTIHFMTRYREELAEGGNEHDVLRRAFSGVGSAMLMTTFVLVAGMLTAVVGDARDARLFGIMGSATLVAALFGDLFLLPALLSRYARPKR